MTPENVEPIVIKFLKDQFAKLGSKNKLEVENLHGGKPWVLVLFILKGIFS
jgi:Cys-Gly metallodipeptidase DUG1